MARDYIMRMVEQIAAMLSTLLAKREAGCNIEVEKELDGHCLRTIGLSLERLKKLSPEAVAQLLNEAGALRPVRAITLAELLLVDAELADEKQDESGAAASRVHAFCLLADSLPILNSEDQTVYREKLKALTDKLGDLKTHPYIAERLGNADL